MDRQRWRKSHCRNWRVYLLRRNRNAVSFLLDYNVFGVRLGGIRLWLGALTFTVDNPQYGS